MECQIEMEVVKTNPKGESTKEKRYFGLNEYFVVPEYAKSLVMKIKIKSGVPGTAFQFFRSWKVKYMEEDSQEFYVVDTKPYRMNQEEHDDDLSIDLLKESYFIPRHKPVDVEFSVIVRNERGLEISRIGFVMFTKPAFSQKGG